MRTMREVFDAPKTSLTSSPVGEAYATLTPGDGGTMSMALYMKTAAAPPREIITNTIVFTDPLIVHLDDPDAMKTMYARFAEELVRSVVECVVDREWSRLRKEPRP